MIATSAVTEAVAQAKSDAPGAGDDEAYVHARRRGADNSTITFKRDSSKGTPLLAVKGREEAEETESPERNGDVQEEEIAREELGELEELQRRIEQLEIEQSKEAAQPTPMVVNPREPSQQERDEHELTHSPSRAWCKHCQRGLARRHDHRSKKPKDKYKRKKFGEIDVPDTEPSVDGIIKFSMDYMQMKSSTEESARYSLVFVNHEDGGVFSYSMPSTGIQGDSMWVPRRLAKDIGGCGNQK